MERTFVSASYTIKLIFVPIISNGAQSVWGFFLLLKQKSIKEHVSFWVYVCLLTFHFSSKLELRSFIPFFGNTQRHKTSKWVLQFRMDLKRFSFVIKIILLYEFSWKCNVKICMCTENECLEITALQTSYSPRYIAKQKDKHFSCFKLRRKKVV